MNTTIDEISLMISKANRVGLVVHINPDGDALGSMSAMAMLIEQMGKPVILYSADKCPENYKFLPQIEKLKQLYEADDAVDLLITLDCGNDQRIKNYEIFRSNIPELINIDHHLDNNNFADINWIGDFAAVGEMVYLFAQRNNLTITPDIAQSLYVSLYTDTGGFRFPNTNTHSLHVASKLIDQAFDMAHTLSMVYERKSFSELLGFAETLSRAELDSSGKIIWTVQPDSAARISFETVDYLRMIDGVEVALVFKQIESQKYKISFRSKGTVDVSEIARHFGGGGHKGAAGAALNGQEAEVKAQVLDYIRSSLNC